jgi:hypothetical protein
MKYRFYNSDTQELYGRVRTSPYLVDGHSGDLPDGHYDLKIIEQEYPVLEITETVDKNISVDLAAKTYNIDYFIRNKTTQELTESLPAARKYQIREWMIDKDISEAFVVGIFENIVDEKERAKAISRWNTVEEIPRTHPLVLAVTAALEMDADETNLEWVNILTR